MSELKLENELANLLNTYSRENDSDTPDHILANYLMGCLRVYECTVKQRDDWHGTPANPLKNFRPFYKTKE